MIPHFTAKRPSLQRTDSHALITVPTDDAEEVKPAASSVGAGIAAGPTKDVFERASRRGRGMKPEQSILLDAKRKEMAIELLTLFPDVDFASLSVYSTPPISPAAFRAVAQHLVALGGASKGELEKLAQARKHGEADDQRRAE